MENDTEYRHISVDMLHEPEGAIRSVIVLEELQELAESIREQGVLEPLLVSPVDGGFQIIAGHRRFLASKIAGLVIVPCLVKQRNEADADLCMLHENSFRESVNPVDEGQFFIRLRDAHGLSLNEIAKKAARSNAYVASRVNLLEGDVRVLEALKGKQLNFSQAVEIDKAESDHVRGELLRVAIESGATVQSLRLMRFDYERALRPSAEQPPEGSTPTVPYAESKHLINCPCCHGHYPVNKIYPISVCKTCYDNILSELQKPAGQEVPA